MKCVYSCHSPQDGHETWYILYPFNSLSGVAWGDDPLTLRFKLDDVDYYYFMEGCRKFSVPVND